MHLVGRARNAAQEMMRQQAPAHRTVPIRDLCGAARRDQHDAVIDRSRIGWRQRELVREDRAIRRLTGKQASTIA